MVDNGELPFAPFHVVWCLNLAVSKFLDCEGGRAFYDRFNDAELDDSLMYDLMFTPSNDMIGQALSCVKGQHIND